MEGVAAFCRHIPYWMPSLSPPATPNLDSSLGTAPEVQLAGLEERARALCAQLQLERGEGAEARADERRRARGALVELRQEALALTQVCVRRARTDVGMRHASTCLFHARRARLHLLLRAPSPFGARARIRSMRSIYLGSRSVSLRPRR